MSFAIKITPTGIIAPTYADILTGLKNAVAAIYGSDVYLGNDSQDLQALAVFAQAIKDNNDAQIAAYLAYSPATAQGIGLSQQVKINGIRRNIFTFSTADVDVVGAQGTPIQNGLIGDREGLGTQWALPALVTIPGSGTITVTATCTTPGAVKALAATLTVMLTPTAGWQSVNNSADAVPGAPVESDAALRRRQASSTSIPAISVVDAILGAIENLIGIERAWIYENDTGAPDGNGVPAHSISAVVQGGDAQSIASTIALYKTPGTGTYGTTTETTVDPFGVPNIINFFQLAVVQIFTIVTLAPLTGYVSTIGSQIAASVAAWYNALAIGEDAYLNRIWSPANLSGDAATEATGLTQAMLDALSNTYNLSSIFQARADMTVRDGPFVAGVNVVHITNTGSLANGKAIMLELDDGSFLTTAITNKAGIVITMAANIPGGRSAANGGLMYVAGDLTIAFNEAAGSAAANVTVVS